MPILAPLDLSQLTTAIGQQETGSGTTGVGASLNNPGAIKFDGTWESAYGATPGPYGFARFPSLANGWAATQALITDYIKKGASLQSLINAWSPPSDGNTNNAARTSQLASITGLDPSVPIASQVAPPASSASGSTSSFSDWLNYGTALFGGETPALSFGFSWSRIAAFTLGLICIIIGLISLRRTQIVIQNVQSGTGNAIGLGTKAHKAHASFKARAVAKAKAAAQAAAETTAEVAAV